MNRQNYCRCRRRATIMDYYRRLIGLLPPLLLLLAATFMGLAQGAFNEDEMRGKFFIFTFFWGVSLYGISII